MIRNLRACVLLGALALPVAVDAQTVQTAGPGRVAIIAAAKEIMTTSRYATLVTIGPAGQPQARIVDPFAPDSNFIIWVATNALTRKVGEIKADARVTLLYFDATAREYATVIGTAQIVDDPAEKLRHWKQEWAEFYSDGPRGSDYVLIRVKPARLEVLSPSRGVLNDPKTWLPAAVDLP